VGGYAPRARKRLCARGACGALLGGPSTSPLDDRVGVISPSTACLAARFRLDRLLRSVTLPCLHFYLLPVFRSRRWPGTRRHDPRLWWFSLASGLVAYGFAWIKWRRLRFTVFQTADDAVGNYEKVMGVIEAQGWLISDKREGEMIAARVRARWSDFTWGELVTVQFLGSQVAINCVGDPYAGRSGSRTDEARTKAEMDLLTRALRVI
jgi:hypothetical protein